MQPDVTASPAAPTPAPAARSLLPACLAAAVFLAYAPAWRAGFVWDDAAHLTAPHLRSAAGLARIWTEPGATQQYYPLLHSLFWLEHRLWGDHATGYHLANLALHAAAAILAALLLRRLAVPGAWGAALLFALHPVQVESVAWVSEQKNTLSAVLALGAALAWTAYDDHRRRRAFWLASALFALGLLAKTVVAVLPAALLVIVWWRRGRIDGRRDFLPLAPWLAAGAAAGLLTAWIERSLIGAEGAADGLSFADRAVLAGRAVWFYAGQIVWPADLCFVHPRWAIDSSRPGQWLPLAALVAAAVAFWCWRRRSRAPLAVLLLYTGVLFPALGFVDIYPFAYSFVADHFQYHASLPLLAAGAAVAARLASRLPPRLSRPVRLLVAAVPLGLAALTWNQARDYRDTETLFRAAVTRNPAAWMAWNNLGRELMGRTDRAAEAAACFERALALRPDYFEAHNNLGLLLTQAGRPAEALPHLDRAIRLQPLSPQAFNNLGIALAGSGRAAAAAAAFRRAAVLDPHLPNTRENWGKALQLLGRHDEAARRFAEADRLRRPPGGR